MLKGRYIRVDVSEGRPGGFQEKAFASDWRSGVEHQVTDRPGRPNFDRPSAAPRGPERVFDRSMMSPVVAEARNTSGASGWRTTAQPINAERPKVAEFGARASPAAVEPAKRPVLNLLPRTKPLPDTPEPAQVYSEKGTSNPFGAAKPKPLDKPAATSNN